MGVFRDQWFGARLARRMPEFGAGPGGVPEPEDRLSGFVAGMRVATVLGWRAVEMLAPGDRVLTFDNGVQEVVALTRGTHLVAGDALPEIACPLSVPAGSVGNPEPMILMPEQSLMVESDIAEAMTGDPFALLPARALVGFRGITPTLGLRPVEVVTVHFAADEVLFVEGGALVLAPAALPGARGLAPLAEPGLPVPYRAWSLEEARRLLAAMADRDTLDRAEAGARAAA